MTQELSAVTVVIIIGCGVLAFVLLFIFAKRQIMRFALRSRRGPHVPIGHGAKKSLRRELERMIDVIPRIVYEPKLMTDDDPQYILQPGTELPPHYFRLKAVDDVRLLEQEITRQDNCLVRHPPENLRAFLLSALAVPLNGLGPKLVHQFCDLYEHARHDPSEFGDEEYQMYSKLLLKLIDAGKMLKSYPNSRKSSPSRTPLKRNQDKYRNLLDTKLRSDRKLTDEVLCVNEKEIRPSSLPVSPDENNETSV
ncbi:protein C1orf43 homolog [Schistocerca cancellata]|uniref:protein C1orf43 homolog n=1 Tax=Schistocerca cancellata TaxID=274614 RepID=UPI0021179F41|nr:protein C1orf43 homolog [Schistocerca cancellata]